MIHYGSQYVDEEDIREVIGVLKSDFLSQGPKIKEFEGQMLAHTGARYCVAVSSGTAALHLAVKALNIKEGKEGITSPVTFVASSNCFVYNNLIPRFADINEKTYCIDPSRLEETISEKTGVIIPVHFAGQPAEMEDIYKIANRRGIFIIEDASHAIKSRFEDGSLVGACSYSYMTTFSFHPVKTITTGEGGAITTNDKALYEKLVMLRNHGLTKDPSKFKIHQPELPGPWYYEIQELGYNYRMNELQAALGVGQLKKIEYFVKRRREIINKYNEEFKDLEWVTTPYEKPGVFSALHLYVIKINFNLIQKSRSQVMKELKEKGINTQVHYIPIHLQPYYRENFGLNEGDFPKAEEYYRQCLSIPLYPKMTDADVRLVIDAITKL